MTDTIQTLQAQITKLMDAKPETGEQWGKICFLEDQKMKLVKAEAERSKKNERIKQQLSGWRAVVYETNLNGVKSIRNICEHLSVQEAYELVDLSEFGNSTPGAALSVEIYPLFS